MIQGTDDTRYAYVNGIIRAREARLLTRGHFDRLIASELPSFPTLLSDTPYAGQKDIDTSLKAEESAVRAFFNQFCQTPDVNQLIDWPEQMHNLKVKLKGGGDNLLYPQEQSKVEHWPEVIEEIERFALEKEPFLLSTNLDKILCKYLYETAQFSPFFSMYYEYFFDLENIRNFLRARQFENSREIFQQVYIPYGLLDKKIFTENLTAHHDLFSKIFFTTPYAKIMDRGSAFIEERHSFLRLERMCEEIKLEFLLQARRMTFGVEPLYGYYHFKMSEIKKLRQVYWGKVNEVPSEDLKESIPDVW